MARLAPFRQLPFRQLPLLPRRRHAYFQTTPHTQLLQTASFGPHEVHYRTAGTGPDLLLIHGLMTSSYSWRYVIAPLSKHFRLVIPDLPGAGRSQKPEMSYHGERLAAWIDEFQGALGIRGCLAVGNSLGGYLCMRTALRNPKAFSKLLNLHSPGLPLKRLWALRYALRAPGAFQLLQGMVQRDPERWVHRNVHYYDETLKSREETCEYALPLRTPSGIRAFYHYLRDTMSVHELSRFEEELELRRSQRRAFPMPLLLLYAQQDPMVPPSMGQRLHDLIPDAQFQELTQASHFAHVDAPHAFVDACLNFLLLGPI